MEASIFTMDNTSDMVIDHNNAILANLKLEHWYRFWGGKEC